MTCREFRKKYSYTLKDLSIETGYSISAISKWERGCDTMPQDFVDEIYNKFDVIIQKQHRNFVLTKKHIEAIDELKTEIDKLNNIINKLQDDNNKLVLKIETIQKICKE